MFTGVVAVVYGAAGFLAEPAPASGGQQRSEVEDRMLESMAAIFPATATVMPHLMAYGSDDQVHGILRALVEGLDARPARRRHPYLESGHARPHPQKRHR